MLSRIFGKSLPEPTTEQLGVDLNPYDLEKPAEVTSIAFEPRYKLLAFGDATGRLFVMNQERRLLASKDAAPTSICRLYACPNTSSFVSVYSQHIYNNHPNQALITPNDSEKESFRCRRHFRTDSVVTHWVVAENKIIPRVISLKEIIVELVVSPSTPNFAMILMTTGALLGFSLEKMKFTDFYVNIFEGKPVKALSCPIGMSYYVAHDQIDVLDIDSMEVDKYSTQKVNEFDLFDGYAASILEDGSSALIKGNKVSSTQKLEEGEKAIYTTLLESEKQFTIVRSKEFDSIMIGNRRVSLPEGVRLAPGIAPIYTKSYFDRAGVSTLYVISTDGRIFNVADSCDELILYPPILDGTKCKAYEYENIIYVTENIGEGSFNVHSMTRNGYIGTKKIDAPYPTTFISGKFVCISPLSIDIVDVKDYKVIRVVEAKESLRVYIHQNSCHVFCDSFPQLYSSDMVNFNPAAEGDMFSPSCSEDIIHALFIKGQECLITKDNSIIYNGEKYEGFDKDDPAVLIECIDDFGKASKDGNYLLVVTKKLLLLFDATDGMKKIRKDTIDHNVTHVSVMRWGGLMTCTPTHLNLLPLPDFTLKSLGKLSAPSEATITPIDQCGIISSDKIATSVYLNDMVKPKLFDQETPALAIPQKKSFFGLINKNTAPTTEEADEKFGFKRSKTQSAASNLAETGQMMQELMVIAQQRSEKLNELEEKANRIRDHARDFAEACRKLNK
ncbi:hypothetical protein TVAG_339330 [Trichomonas vaginalis G3]|uniref:V-SNARE coiled-coil homology domain-containing protein n=1 Tax=Trichomonas vaginalis (strain ATCC PRA-98 / G3) TaxID=412133 RepID=A2F8Y9_TRIV3|nr:R-SNARE STXBP5 6 domain-containing protein [Trichomonas vaginalis G3]EAX98616.1 hypothetical protein TVAG_339330 [Trichomonas vaginalis G3]KAI5513413.1 R-SNARE STXBP5 6 domain-containing protein [Trichomonas vaginalis G3]|eukprot:XP_001311546.1 hypothetical protein [Trichomonas vaginalis G3]